MKLQVDFFEETPCSVCGRPRHILHSPEPGDCVTLPRAFPADGVLCRACLISVEDRWIREASEVALLLAVNYKWFSEDARDFYKRRLAGGQL